MDRRTDRVISIYNKVSNTYIGQFNFKIHDFLGILFSDGGVSTKCTNHLFKHCLISHQHSVIARLKVVVPTWHTQVRLVHLKWMKIKDLLFMKTYV